MKERTNLNVLLIQIAVGAAIWLLTPLMIYAFTRNYGEALHSLMNMTPAFVIIFVVFMINYWWLVPHYQHRNKKLLYFGSNIALFALIMFGSIMFWRNHLSSPREIIIVVSSTSFLTLMFFTGSVAFAFALRNSLRNKILYQQIQEEKRRHAEAELVWLKNQLNPHFLFNTLNNISALTAFDVEKAQESIGRLSELLRYAMYETTKESVPLVKEIEFMKDYLELMNLRCNANTSVNTEFDIESESAEIAPLLLVSIIENAFKHGVSANRPSEISISLNEKNGLLSFISSNTNHAKDSGDRSGSGIGLSNMRRRLQLLYDGRYEWIEDCDDNKFQLQIRLRL